MIREREQEVFDFVVRFKRENDGNSPAYSRIGREVFLSNSQVKVCLDRLRAQGLIDFVKDGSNNKGIIVVGGVWQLAGGV